MKTPAHVRLLQEELKQTKCRLEACEELAPAMPISADAPRQILATSSWALHQSDSTAPWVSSTVNATGYYLGFVFQVQTPGGLPVTVNNTSEFTICMNPGAVLNNPGSTYRIGIQDVNPATGVGDGTFDVYCDLVGGTNTIAGGLNTFQVTTGSKVLNHGDLVAFEMRCISYGAGDDFRPVQADTFYTSRPYRYIFQGSGPTRSQTTGVVIIKGSQGELISPSKFYMAGINSDSAYAVLPPNPNPTFAQENGVSFTLQQSARLSEFSFAFAGQVGGIPLVYTLYSDPTGTPQIVAQTQVLLNHSGPSAYRPFIRMVMDGYPLLTAGVEYGLIMSIPSGNQDAEFNVMQFGPGNAYLKNITPLGQDWAHLRRTGATGPFTKLEENLPYFAMYLDT